MPDQVAMEAAARRRRVVEWAAQLSPASAAWNRARIKTPLDMVLMRQIVERAQQAAAEIAYNLTEQDVDNSAP